MKKMQMASISALSKKAMLASWVEKPPLAKAGKLGPMASHGVMPAIH